MSAPVAAAILLVLALSTAPAAGQPRVSVVASGLEAPWALAFAPDGTLYVTERPGRLRVVRDGRLDPAPVAVLPAAARGEAGLMGLALDPAFALNGQLYVCYTTMKADRMINRVSALVLRDGRAVEERVLLDDIPGAGFHDGCRLKFGPDGQLYVTTGDAGEPQLRDARFEDPVLESGLQTWAPSGIAVLGDYLYMALLRGQRLLRVRLDPDGGATDPTDLLARAFGRLRDVVAGPDGALYVTTSNRDGRGSPGRDDDRILRVEP